jgi:DNA-binding protein Fis
LQFEAKKRRFKRSKRPLCRPAAGRNRYFERDVNGSFTSPRRIFYSLLKKLTTPILRLNRNQEELSTMLLTEFFENTNAVSFTQDLLQNRIEALRALATLMLREVDSMEKNASPEGSGLNGIEFCLQSEVQRYEADLIRSALVKAHGRQRQAARLLGVKVTTLNAKIKRYDINWRVVGIESEFVA